MTLSQHTSNARFMLRSRIRVFLLLGVGILLLIVGLVAWFWTPADEVYRLTVSGGVSGLNRSEITQYLSRHAEEIGLQVETEEAEGTQGVTSLVNNGELDLALANGLLRIPSAERVRQVAPLTIEAVHLLVKDEHAEKVRADFDRLRELTIHTGPPGGETELLTQAILAFCGIELDQLRKQNPDQFDQTPLQTILRTARKTQTRSEERAKLIAKLPDVVIHASTLPSPLAKHLIQGAGYELLALPFADAFRQITVAEEDLDRDHIDQLRVVETEIPAFMYGTSPPTPENDLKTIGCPLIVITNDSVPEEVIARLLPAIYEGAVRRVYHPRELRQVAPTYRWHEASLAYRDKDKPILRADVARMLQQLISLVAPVFGGGLALYGYYRWRQTLRFVDYFEQFQAIDLRAKGYLNDGKVTPAELEEASHLEADLTKLQQQAVSDFCRNYFYADGMVRTFLQLLGETREFLRLASLQSSDLHKATGVAETPSVAETRNIVKTEGENQSE